MFTKFHVQNKAQTVHRAFGLKDGRYSKEQMTALILNQDDDYYNDRRNLIRSTDCLIIDEISMLSARILELVDTVCRAARDEPDKPFGGLHTIFVGKTQLSSFIPMIMYETL